MKFESRTIKTIMAPVGAHLFSFWNLPSVDIAIKLFNERYKIVRLVVLSHREYGDTYSRLLLLDDVGIKSQIAMIDMIGALSR
jgi:hypothetical protein